VKGPFETAVFTGEEESAQMLTLLTSSVLRWKLPLEETVKIKNKERSIF
jgi:hypothetical protein